MDNKLHAALQYNKGALDAIWSQLSGATVPSSLRNDLVWAYVSIAIGHHRAIHHLAAKHQTVASLALLRPQIETWFRGMWVHLIATDDQVNAIRERGDEPFPRFRQMAADLDHRYVSDGWLQTFADQWTSLNGYTHSGLEQLGRQFRDDGTIGPNYPENLVIDGLVLSGTTSIGCIVPIFRGVGLNDKADALEQWLALQKTPYVLSP
jgi:hypothetical protein